MIDILMLSTEHIDEYTQYSIPIWKKYCERHGYNFCHYSKKLIEDMAFTWSRIKMIQDHFQKTEADYVVMVDADTFLYHDSLDLKLEDLIEKYMIGEKRILFQKDGSDRLGIYFTHNIVLSGKMKRWTLPNAGFNMMKNSKETHAFIDKWLELGQGELRHLADVHPRTQNVLLHGLMVDPEMDKLIGYLPSKIVSKRNTRFVRHLSAMTKAEIANEIKKEYDLIFQEPVAV